MIIDVIFIVAMLGLVVLNIALIYGIWDNTRTIKKVLNRIEIRMRLGKGITKDASEKILVGGFPALDEIVEDETRYMTDEQLADEQAENYRKSGYTREQINKAMHGEF